MHLLSVHNLSFSWGYKSLLNNLSFNLNQGETLGIAGPNGSGKSTLINILRGSLAPDSGKVSFAPQSRLALVSQEADFGDARTVGDYLLSAIRPLAAAIAELEVSLGQPSDEKTMAARLVEFGEAQEAFLAAGGYQAEEQASRLLSRTGLAITMDQELASLSGGEKSVLTIVQALVADPDLLILDEPGNHLDYLGLQWLETFLQEMDTGIILISHNRYLLDRCAGTILYLEAGRHWLHKGSYSSFRQQRELELAEERKAWIAREKELHQLNIELKDWLAQAAQSYNPPPRVMIQLGETKKKIARLREIHDKGLTPLARGIRINLKGEELKGEIALDVRGLNLSYGSRLVLNDLCFSMKRGDRSALVGLNGSGKSSLIRLIREEANWDNPRLRLAPSMKVGYLSQQNPFPDLQRSLVDEVRDWGPLSIDAAFNLISPFAFPWEELDKPLASLSGGELQRLQLAQLSYRQVNFLILDEPSNHLDIPGREALEACLAAFPGTMLIVSHDRYFLDSFATRILHLEAGRIQEYEGNFSQFLDGRQIAASAPAKPRDGGILNRDSVQTRKPQAAPATKQAAAAPASAPPAKPASAVSALEADICRLESEITKVEQAILEALDGNAGLAERLESGLVRKRQELEKLYKLWAHG